MTIPTRIWLYAVAAVALFLAGVGYGYHTRDLSAIIEAQALELKRTQDANQAWAERFALQGQLSTRDQQLAQAQKDAESARGRVVIQKETIYRDRIKNVAVRDCVRDSGLLDVYDAALGLSDPAE
jgi:hypothetical protein